MLQTVDIETAAQVDAAVIWLHGLGADAHDFEPVVPQLLSRGERAWRFVFPDAPVRPVTINGGMRMRAWYDIYSFDRGAGVDEAGFRDTDRLIGELIAREIGRGILPERIVLGGFSQGGALSLYSAPRYPERLAGVLALSCYLPMHERLAVERDATNNATPVFMGHGRADPIIPAALGAQSRDWLRALGYPVEWHDYAMAHAVCQAELADIRGFLLRVLP